MGRSKFLSLFVILVVLAFLMGRHFSQDRDDSVPVDNCTSCHQVEKDPSPSHPVSVLGCSMCHLGNPYAREKKRAHLGLTKNPGDLRIARLTCGTRDCHPDLPERVAKSLMATNRGILEALQTRWPHRADESVTEVRQLISKPPGESMALDHYRKMCGGCHLWKVRDPRKGEIGKRGGGCTNCHLLELSVQDQDLSQKRFQHPQLTTRIPNENCLKCHNRSARTALTYLGRFESEGYGTPHEVGELNGRRMTGGRFFLELHPDVHYQKAGLDCIDCHTEKGVMGDGNRYAHMKEQVDITCESCHSSEWKKFGESMPLAERLLRNNGAMPPGEIQEGVKSRKGSPLYHLRRAADEKITLFRKRDGKGISFKRLGSPEIHGTPYHDRLSCQACHSMWTPQCYGCHVALLKGEKQIDWLSGERRPGRWVEGRSYLRFERPTLGIMGNGKIGPFAPGCQVFLNVFDEDGVHQPELAHRSLTMAGFDPHSTATNVPGCLACHMDPKVLGLGEGALKVNHEGLSFSPLYDSPASGLGISFPLDAFVSVEGTPLQKASGKGARPFNRDELKRITAWGLCLTCHDQYKDPIYNDYEKSLRRFNSGEAPCRDGLGGER